MVHRLLLLITAIILGTPFYSQNTKLVLNTVTITLPGPGQWKQTKANEASGQRMFQNENTNKIVLVSARLKNKFEFYNDTLSDFDFVNAFYKWDSNYWASDEKNEVSHVKTNRDKKYIIWRLKTPQGSNTILNGIKNDRLVGIQVPDNSIADGEKRVEFLETVFVN